MGIKTESENHDNVDMSLPWGQSAVIEAVIDANSATVVVLQTGNPVEMAWRAKARAIIESWYSGNVGGRAIAGVLSGAVHPSGHLPVTFYESVEQAEKQLPPYRFDAVDQPILPKGCALIGVELLDAATLLPSFRHPLNAVYVFGPERSALSPALVARCARAARPSRCAPTSTAR